MQMQSSALGFAAVFAIFAVICPLFGAGIWLVARGRWGRRVGNVPHCRRCGYVLTGNESGTCSECGSLLSKNAIVLGERPRRPHSLAAGVFLLLMGCLIVAFFIFTSVMQVDWYRYRPTSWVIGDLDSSNPALPDQAWKELKRRIAASGISAAQEHALIERALREQQSAANTLAASDELVDYLDGRYAAGRLDAAEVQRFFDSAMKIRFDVRPVVGPKDSIAYRIACCGRGPSGWWMNESEGGFWIDDKKINHGISSGSGGFNGMSASSVFPHQRVGKHRIRIDYKLTAGRGMLPTSEAPVGEQSRTIHLAADVTVVKNPPPILLLTAPDAATIQSNFSAYDFRLSSAGYLEGMIKNCNAQIPMAFKVFARTNGKEYPMGDVQFNQSAPGGACWGVNLDRVPSHFTGPIDLILRSSEEAAIQTPDMTQIWKGEVVIANIPVRQPPGASK